MSKWKLVLQIHMHTTRQFLSFLLFFFSIIATDRVDIRRALQVEYLHQHPAVACVGAQVNIFTDMAAAGDTTSVPARTTAFPSDHFHIHWRMFFSCCIAHPAVVMRRSILDQVPHTGLYHERPTTTSSREPSQSMNALHVEDYELWLRLLESPHAFRFKNLNFVGIRLRKHATNISRTKSSDQQRHRAEVRVQVCSCIFTFYWIPTGLVSSARSLQHT